MPKFTIEIDCENAAFDGNPAQEVARILAALSGRVLMDIGTGTHAGTLADYNGNKVGKWELTQTCLDAASAARKIEGFALCDALGDVVSDYYADPADAQAEAVKWNASDAESGAEDAGQDVAAFIKGLQDDGLYPFYTVKAIDGDGNTHDPAKLMQFGDVWEVSAA